MPTSALLDQQTTPSVRDAIVTLMTRAHFADLAIAEVRLGAIDLSDRDVAQVAQTRFLLARLDSTSLDLQRDQLQRLYTFAQSGKLQVRCAGLQRWTPDFSIYRGLSEEPHDCVLLGAHYFRPLSAHSSAFTTCIIDPRQVLRAAARFESLWQAAYDVLPPIMESIADVLNGTDAGHAS